MRISFDPSLGIIIPETLSTCEQITGFTTNPSCLKVSAHEIIVACSSISQNTFPNYSFKINGITNPTIVRSITNQIKVQTKTGNTVLDES